MNEILMSKDEINKLSFEKAMEALESIVTKLEQGEATLEDSIKYYETGELLKDRCDELLKNAEQRIEIIKLSREGKAVGVEDFKTD